MKRLTYLFVFFATLSFSAGAQQVQQTGWLASFNTFGLNSKWSVHFDAQLRTNDNFEQVQTILLRPGLNYHINRSLIATAGYAFIPNRRTISHMSDLFTEHRAWQQMVFNHKISTVATTQHRLRFEQRFIPQVDFTSSDIFKTGHNQAFRLRYFIRNIVPLKQQPLISGPFFALQNEVFLNTGTKTAVNGRLFDQNRLYLALGYRLPNSKFDVEAGYLNQYSEGRNRTVTNNHVAQLALYKRL